MIVKIPFSEIERVSIYLNRSKKSVSAIKSETGADCILNGTLYNMGTFQPVCHLRSDGVTACQPAYTTYGYAWDELPELEVIPGKRRNHIACVTVIRDRKKEAMRYDAALGGKRGRSAMGRTADSLVLLCTKDGGSEAMTPEELQDELYRMGCMDAVMLDGGGSSQCDFAGKQIKASRKVHNWICVWTKKTAESPPQKEDKPVSKPVVCLDPGHGPGCANGSLDGSYKECEFTWDLYTRLRPLLEAQGITVVGTREQKSDYPSLSARASVSNRAGADLFVSLHSNAAGSSARGFVAFTSAPPETAARNRLAAAIINRVHAAGVVLWGSGLAHELYTVLASTTAPAVLLEYGFHTNAQDLALLKDAAYRDKLAQATCAGICDYLGLEVKEPDQESGQPNEPDSWAKEAWSKATAAGIFDGTRPRDALTRQEAAVVLDRLNLL